MFSTKQIQIVLYTYLLDILSCQFMYATTLVIDSLATQCIWTTERNEAQFPQHGAPVLHFLKPQHGPVLHRPLVRLCSYS